MKSLFKYFTVSSIFTIIALATAIILGYSSGGTTRAGFAMLF